MASGDWTALGISVLIFAVLGIVCLFFTRIVWGLTVKLGVKGEAEPSKSYLFMTRLSGVAFLVLIPVIVVYAMNLD